MAAKKKQIKKKTQRPRHSQLRPHPQSTRYNRLIDFYVYQLEPEDEETEGDKTVSIVKFKDPVQEIGAEAREHGKTLTPREVKFLKGRAGVLVINEHGRRHSRPGPGITVIYYDSEEVLEENWRQAVEDLRPDEEEYETPKRRRRCDEEEE